MFILNNLNQKIYYYSSYIYNNFISKKFNPITIEPSNNYHIFIYTIYSVLLIYILTNHYINFYILTNNKFKEDIKILQKYKSRNYNNRYKNRIAKLETQINGYIDSIKNNMNSYHNNIIIISYIILLLLIGKEIYEIIKNIIKNERKEAFIDSIQFLITTFIKEFFIASSLLSTYLFLNILLLYYIQIYQLNNINNSDNITKLLKYNEINYMYIGISIVMYIIFFIGSYYFLKVYSFGNNYIYNGICILYFILSIIIVILYILSIFNVFKGDFFIMLKNNYNNKYNIKRFLL